MLEEAYRDLKYLLNRGYRKKYALDFVANHYRLTLEERHLLARCVFPDSWVEEVRRKLLKLEELAGRTLAIDGFNVLITLESIMEGKGIICEDGLVRDLKYQGRYKLNENTEELLEKIAGAVSGLEVRKAVFFYGRNVPKSGVVKALTEEALKRFGLQSEVHLVKNPDFELKGFETVATADVGVISKVPHVFDLAQYIAQRLGKRPQSFVELLGEA
ncbi:DUF434 domain-containing protein [Thermococcus pacificus]|uniref:DUF434 domain-containing protein n=1 Tax=Thermococcus pacificus TaxID=71998 RepID=A0A218P6S0_9EURY|nr:DUF434 domain-containing protein [Thermococcus pacificus]ASJ06467.1 hypothetical protein A3L08_03555 [Thermococcus pacificus]